MLLKIDIDEALINEAFAFIKAKTKNFKLDDVYGMCIVCVKYTFGGYCAHKHRH